MLLRLLINSFVFNLAFFIFVKNDFAQTSTLRIYQEGSYKTKITLEGFYGNTSYLIDSTWIDNISFNYSIKSNQFYEGFYRLVINDTLTFDFIATNNDTIDFVFNPLNFHNSLKIEKSNDNILLLQFKKEISQFNSQINILKNTEVYDSISFYAVRNLVTQMKIEKNKMIFKYQSNFKNKIFSILANMNKEILANNPIDAEQEFFSNIHFENECIIRTNSYPLKLIDYFAYFYSPDEKSFKIACDSLLSRASVNSVVYNYTLHFLLKLFSEIGPEVIFHYILSNHYLKNSCDLAIDNIELAGRIQKFTSLMPGNRIPILIGQDLNGKLLSYFEKNLNKKTILFFWNPNCFFCTDLVPKLIKAYPKIKRMNFNIISFAITTSKMEWKDMRKKYKFPWSDISDLNGWDSPQISKFMVTKSPFIIIIDEKLIIQKFDLKPENLNKLYE